MECLFRNLKSEWIPATGYLTAQEAQRDISHYLMHRYNWIRPHRFNNGLPPAVAEEQLNPLSGMGWPLQKAEDTLASVGRAAEAMTRKI